jgi:hypothetical protein
MNAEQALQCVDLAAVAIQAGDWEKAERMLVKSVKLNDTEEA